MIELVQEPHFESLFEKAGRVSCLGMLKALCLASTFSTALFRFLSRVVVSELGLEMRRVVLCAEEFAAPTWALQHAAVNACLPRKIFICPSAMFHRDIVLD